MVGASIVISYMLHVGRLGVCLTYTIVPCTGKGIAIRDQDSRIDHRYLYIETIKITLLVILAYTARIYSYPA